MKRIRVLIVDDSVVIRRLVARVLESDPRIEVIGTAPNGRIALDKVEQHAPDLVTLDVEMPEMDGLTALARMRERWPDLPVIMFSALTERGAVHTLDALSLGAIDYVTKPTQEAGPDDALASVRDMLIPKIHGICAPDEIEVERMAPVATVESGVPAIVGIAASTGGPDAIPLLLRRLPEDFPIPVLVVQHMPGLFTRHFAERLDAKVALRVAEAVDGAPLEGGRVWVAPGGRHLVVEDGQLRTYAGPPELSCRPSANVLFRSLARGYGAQAAAVVLTGMGRDGLEGCAEIRDAGGCVFAQDRRSCTVWGMPGFVAEAGLAETIAPPDLIGEELKALLGVEQA